MLEHIKLDDLEYKQLTTNRNGGKMVNVSTKMGSNEYKDRIRFQMSENERVNLQTAVWGLSTPMPGADASRRTLDLTIESPSLETFLCQLDNKNIDTACSKSFEWFKKEIDRSAIEQMYTYLVRPGKEGKPNMVRVKVKCGEYPTNIYVVQEEDVEGNIKYVKGTADDLAKNARCLVVVETNGLWFMNRQFGMSLTATEILVWPTKRTNGIDAFTMSSQARLCAAEDMQF